MNGGKLATTCSGVQSSGVTILTTGLSCRPLHQGNRRYLLTSECYQPVGVFAATPGCPENTRMDEKPPRTAAMHTSFFSQATACVDSRDWSVRYWAFARNNTGDAVIVKARDVGSRRVSIQRRCSACESGSFHSAREPNPKPYAVFWACPVRRR